MSSSEGCSTPVSRSHWAYRSRFWGLIVVIFFDTSPPSSRLQKHLKLISETNHIDITTGPFVRFLFFAAKARGITAQLPVCVDVLRFLRRNGVCMHDSPQAWIVFANKNHARPRLQSSIKPCQRVRCVGSQFDLDDVFHYAPTHLLARERTAASFGKTRSPATRTRDALCAVVCFNKSAAD